MKKWNILGVVVFQTELHKDIPVLEHYSSLNFLASLPMKRPATQVVLVGAVLMDFQHCKSHCTLHLCVGAIGSQNGHLWTSVCVGCEITKEVWCEATLLFEIFHFKKIFNPVCAFTTGAQPLGRSPDMETFWCNCVAPDWFQKFLGPKALAITITSAHALGAVCLSVVPKERFRDYCCSSMPNSSIIKSFLTFSQLNSPCQFVQTDIGFGGLQKKSI